MAAITKDGIYTQIAISENTLYNESPFRHIAYQNSEEMAGKEIVKMAFIDEPEILDAAIEKFQQNFTSATPSTNSLLSHLELLKRM